MVALLLVLIPKSEAICIFADEFLPFSVTFCDYLFTMSMLATDPKKDSATDYECNVVTMEDKLYMIKQYEKVENV